MELQDDELFRSFEGDTLDPDAFTHRNHVRVGYEMLCRYDFATAAARYCDGIRKIANRAGAGQKFNTTITLAFLSVIAERMGTTFYRDSASFLAANPDIVSGNPLVRWYSGDRLSSDLARRVFLMPDALIGGV